MALEVIPLVDQKNKNLQVCRPWNLSRDDTVLLKVYSFRMVSMIQTVVMLYLTVVPQAVISTMAVIALEMMINSKPMTTQHITTLTLQVLITHSTPSPTHILVRVITRVQKTTRFQVYQSVPMLKVSVMMIP